MKTAVYCSVIAILFVEETCKKSVIHHVLVHKPGQSF